MAASNRFRKSKVAWCQTPENIRFECSTWNDVLETSIDSVESYCPELCGVSRYWLPGTTEEPKIAHFVSGVMKVDARNIKSTADIESSSTDRSHARHQKAST